MNYERILVVVPHSDDEVLLAGGVISRAIKEQKQIAVAVVTNGDYLCKDASKGSIRLLESLEALRFLGMKEESIYFLGYPDTGMEPEVSFLHRLMREEEETKKYPSTAFSHTYGIVDGKSDYHWERTGKHADYDKKSLEEDLVELIQETKPDLVITTSSWDMHGDHSGLSYFIRKILKEKFEGKKLRPILWEGIVHSTAGDGIWPVCGTKESSFTMPPNLEADTDLIWENRISIPLLAEDIREDKKRKAILKYRQALDPQEPDVVQYLLSFAKGEEVFFSFDY